MKVSDQEVFAKYQSLSNSAKNRGLDFNLTYTSVKNLLRAKKCYYTGIEFSQKDRGLGKTIDRVDPNKGYVIGNCVACIDSFNQFKAEFEKAGEEGMKNYFKAMQKLIKEMK